jgi:hypothetical protein
VRKQGAGGQKRGARKGALGGRAEPARTASEGPEPIQNCPFRGARDGCEVENGFSLQDEASVQPACQRPSVPPNPLS